MFLLSARCSFSCLLIVSGHQKWPKIKVHEKKRPHHIMRSHLIFRGICFNISSYANESGNKKEMVITIKCGSHIIHYKMGIFCVIYSSCSFIVNILSCFLYIFKVFNVSYFSHQVKMSNLLFMIAKDSIGNARHGPLWHVADFMRWKSQNEP